MLSLLCFRCDCPISDKAETSYPGQLAQVRHPFDPRAVRGTAGTIACSTRVMA